MRCGHDGGENTTMNGNSYYAPTAYDSTRPRALPPRTPHAQLPRVAQVMRGDNQNLAWGIYVGDYRNNNSRGDIYKLKTKDEQTLMAETSPEIMLFPTLRNPKAAWAMVRGVAGLISLVIVWTFFDDWRIGNLHYYLEDPLRLWFSIAPLAVFLVASLIIPFVKNKNNIILNRRTGMVSLPGRSGKGAVELPFDEFDAYMSYGTDPKSGSLYWRLHLGHRTSYHGFNINSRIYKTAYGYQLWESLQQFMDISKPLTDIALTEPVRHLDPTTVAYDQAHHRPPHFWRDRHPDEVKAEADVVEATIRDFRWEYLPHGNDPYGQYVSLDAWRERYPQDAAVADSLRQTGWWNEGTETDNAKTA